jgi:predicted phage-related endonuclease
MLFELLDKPTHGSLEWLRQRWRDSEGRCVFGASDIPVLMNASPWRNRAELFVDKSMPPTLNEETPAMRRGNLLEPVLLSEAGRLLGVEIVTPNKQYKKGRLVVSYDGLPFNQLEKPDFVVEAKTTASKTVESIADIGADWRWQGWAQSEMFGGVPVFFVVFDKRQNITIHELPDNPSARQQLVEETEIFGNRVDNQEPLGDLINEMSAEQIASYFPSSKRIVELPVNATNWLTSLEMAREMKADAEKQEKLAKDELARLLQDADVGTLNGISVVSWKETAGRASLDVKAFKADYPEMHDKYTKLGASYRTMRMLNQKKEKQ